VGSWGGRTLGRSGVDVGGVGRRGSDGSGRGGVSVCMDFGGGEEDVLRLVGPIQGDGGGEGDEEFFKGHVGFGGGEAVA